MATHLYEPLDTQYFDPTDARAERDRTFQICSDCRLCVRLCPSFKDLFRMIDDHDVEGAHDVKVLTDEEHTVVVDECYQCKLCYVVCPYTPDQQQEWKVDFPRLMLRSAVTNRKQGHKPGRGARLLARTDLQGKIATKLAPVVNTANNVRFVRTLMDKTTGIAHDRKLPAFARERFSKWFGRREPGLKRGTERAGAALFATCLVEYQEPAIGKAVVGVCERNGISCDLPEGQVCCGMPWLDAADVDKFEELAKRNVEVLAPAVKAGKAVIVPQPTCAYVIKNEYADFLGTDDARLVGDNTYDVAEYLTARHREQSLDTDFRGTRYGTITWQHACHYRAQQFGPKSRDLMALTGAKVTMVERCSAIDGTWGLRAENVDMAKRIARPLMETITKSESELIAGDCHLANTAITEQTGKVPLHPVQVLARAYGIDQE